MAVYTIISASEHMKQRPCWMVDAPSAAAALKEAWRLREEGMMPWLSPQHALSVRRASKVERDKFAKLIQIKPVSGEALGGDEAARRAERVTSAFFQKLWNQAI